MMDIEKNIRKLGYLFLIVCIFFAGCVSEKEGSSASNTNFTYPDEKVGVNNYGFYLPSSSNTPYPAIKSSEVKNIILLIGDGMGFGQVELARIKSVGIDKRLYMERMPITGVVSTQPLGSLVTDSAAAGTALATGYKTVNGTISMTPDGKKCLTILEAAKEKGMKTGLVVTSPMTHATPAVFAAHTKSRKMDISIAKQMLENKVNVLFGGGRTYFIPKPATKTQPAQEDLIAKAISNGYEYIKDFQELQFVKGPYILGLFQMGPLNTNDPKLTLSKTTEKAIEVLNKSYKEGSSGNGGFFLMVEGSQIDWACHANNADNMVRLVLLFDQAVEKAINFAIEDGKTLVVVTADHETGGLTINDGRANGTGIKVGWATRGHSATFVPVYAFGPGSDLFTGVYDDTDIPKKFAKLLGIEDFPKKK